MIDIDVTVMPKQSVLDPQGSAVARSLHSLGHVAVSQVRIGRHIELSIEGDDEQAAIALAQQMCELLLANTVVETYSVGVRQRNTNVLAGDVR